MRTLSWLVVSVLLGTLLAAGSGTAEAAPPVADSGPPISLRAGDDAVLAGSASDPDGDPLDIKWLHSTFDGGDWSSCTFTGPTAYEPLTPAGLAPTLSCLEPGKYLMQLVAADGTSFFDSLGALVTFTENHRPVVDSGPSVVATAGTGAVLDGSATDPDGDPLEISWLRSVVSGGDLSTCTFTGSTGWTPLTAAGLAPTLTCTQPGDYLMQLRAGDGLLMDDDIGALVSFLPADATPAVCRLMRRTRLHPGIRVRIADPQSAVRSYQTIERHNLTVSPARGRFAPAVPAAVVGVTRPFPFASGRAVIRHRNGAGVVDTCEVRVRLNGSAVVLN